MLQNQGVAARFAAKEEAIPATPAIRTAI